MSHFLDVCQAGCTGAQDRKACPQQETTVCIASWPDSRDSSDILVPCVCLPKWPACKGDGLGAAGLGRSGPWCPTNPPPHAGTYTRYPRAGGWFGSEGEDGRLTLLRGLASQVRPHKPTGHIPDSVIGSQCYVYSWHCRQPASIAYSHLQLAVGRLATIFAQKRH